MADRQAKLVALIAKAIGQDVVGEEIVADSEWALEQGEDVGVDLEQPRY